jgi:putative membrane protein
VLRLTAPVVTVGFAAAASAHGPGVSAVAAGERLGESGAAGEAWIVGALCFVAVAYGAGVARLWRASARGRGISRREAGAFAAGWVILALALLGPLDAWAGRSFAAHMTQHELLMLVAAPLLVRGRPLAAWSWTLGERLRATTHRWLTRSAWRHVWRTFTRPLGATALQLAVLFAWHVPAWFDRAATHAGVHALQHASFLAAALCFWWAVRASASSRRATSGVAIACLFVTMLATGALGALLTFAPIPWYRAYADGGPWGLSALEDQQLGGLLMWVPGGFAYLLAGLVHAARILGHDRPALRADEALAMRQATTTRDAATEDHLARLPR